MKSRRLKPQPRDDQLEALFVAAEYLEDSGDVRAAFQCLLVAAQSGHEFSQVNLGNLYSAGTGVRKNLKKAAYWYRKAYDNQSHGVRSSCAAFNLALDFRNSGNLKTAIKWLEKARALKHGSACLELARINMARKGGRQKAVALLNEVVELDNNYASDLDKEAAEAMLKVLLLH